MKKLLFLAVSLMMIMSSCAAPVEVPILMTEVISIPTETPSPTITPTTEQTPSVTAIPTLTPTTVPVYTELGEQAIYWADFFGWDIVLCDDSVIQEDLDKGIFLLKENSEDFFCDFRGFMEEPLPKPEGTGNIYYIFALWKIKGSPGLGPDGYTFLSTANDKYVKSPSTMTAEDWTKLYFYSSLEQYLKDNPTRYRLLIRTWPINEDEYDRCEVTWRANRSGSSD